LDDNPANWELRLIYSDYLEENNLEDLALAQRWMVKNKKHPIEHNDPINNNLYADSKIGWVLKSWLYRFPKKSQRKQEKLAKESYYYNCIIPDEICEEMRHEGKYTGAC